MNEPKLTLREFTNLLGAAPDLLEAILHERDELVADQIDAVSPSISQHYARRIARLDAAIARVKGEAPAS